MRRVVLAFVLIFFSLNGVYGSDTLFAKYKIFIAKPKAIENLRTLQLVGVIVDDKNDSLEFVLHRILPDTLRLQVRFGKTHAITVICGQTGWIVDPMRNIFDPKELHPDEIWRIRSNILNLFSFIDQNLIEQVKSWDKVGPDTNYISFAVENSTKDTIYYYFNKSNYSDNYRIINFFHFPYTFKVIPKSFFAYMGWSIPRQIEVYANEIKKTILFLVNININGHIDRNLFLLKK